MTRAFVVGGPARWALLCVALWVGGAPPSIRADGGRVVINEIQYHPPASLGEDEFFEFVELHNTGSTLQSLDRWILKDGDPKHVYRLPEETAIPAGGFLVVARNPDAFRLAYGDAIPAVGGFDFGFSNGGDAVRLFDERGRLVDRVDYRDGSPWPAAADGGGATLERVTPDRLEVDDFTAFAPSDLSSPPGTPGRENSRHGPRDPRFDLVISEIAYNPVRDDTAAELRHCESLEFLEIHNRGTASVDLTGWQLGGGVRYTFPAGISIAASGYLAVYKDAGEFQARHPEAPAAVGPFAGRLSNSGEDLTLVDAEGMLADRLRYADTSPWPVRPDGIRGTLELADPRADNALGSNWTESVDNRGSPGARNTASHRLDESGGTIGPHIERVVVLPSGTVDGERTNVLSSDAVRVRAEVSRPGSVPGGELGELEVFLDYQVVAPGDYIRLSDPRAMEWVALAMSFLPERAEYEATIPPQPHRTLVRYRLRASWKRDAPDAPVSAETLLPRALDPEPNLAYFVYDGLPEYVAAVQSDFGDVPVSHGRLAGLPVYHMIGQPGDIEAAQYMPVSDNVYHWKVTIVWYWQDPATGAVESHVHDHVPMRLRGGVNRYIPPKRSWKLRFNKGNPLRSRRNDGSRFPSRRHLNLIAQQHEEGGLRGEAGLFASLGWKLFRETGVTAGETSFVQLRVIDGVDETAQYEGDFFGIFLDVERIGAELLDRLDLPNGEDAGLYKIEGNMPEKKHADCSPSLLDVEEFISGYQRNDTPEWFLQNFDVEKYLSFRSIVELIDHSDLGHHNYYYYRNTDSDLWEMVPWDLDGTFLSGGRPGPEPFQNRVLPLFEERFTSRLRFLWQTVFALDRLEATVDSWSALIEPVASADMDRWNRGPGCSHEAVPGNQCGHYGPVSERARSLKQWFVSKRATVQSVFEDPRIPAQPLNVDPWPDATPSLPLRLFASAFSDPDGDTHRQSHWLLIEDGGDWVEPVWERYSEQALETVDVGEVEVEELVIGGRYQYRVRYQDSTGRWSLLSEPTGFGIARTDGSPPTSPMGLELTEGSARRVAFRWEASSDPDSGVAGYRVYRDGVPLVRIPQVGTSFRDVLPVPGASHVYTVSAVNLSGVESAPSEPLAVTVPAGNVGGWLAPEGGFDYFYDALQGEDAYVPETWTLGTLDGTWLRSPFDRWDGSRPGEGAVPGGVEILEVAGAGEDGGPISVLSLEDSGDPSGDGIASTANNGRFLFFRPLAAPDPFAGDGFTLVARWRVHPAPADLAGPTGQSPSQGKGQIGIARFSPESRERRHVSAHREEQILSFGDVDLPVDDAAGFHSVWIRCAPLPDDPATYSIELYRDGAAEPIVMETRALSRTGVEPIVRGQATSYLELGLSNRSAPGAIQIDFIGYRYGAQTPHAAGASGDELLRGDADGDGRITIVDPLRVVAILFTRRETGCLDAADADDDGAVTVGDATGLLRFLFRNEAPPREPFPSCGADPTDDGLGSCEGTSCDQVAGAEARSRHRH